jgi:hypothetical protein
MERRPVPMLNSPSSPARTGIPRCAMRSAPCCWTAQPGPSPPRLKAGPGRLLARRTSLQTDLDAATRHRATTVERLATLVDQALRTVRNAARLSTLPAILGNWGSEFLRIRFTWPDAAMIA